MLRTTLKLHLYTVLNLIVVSEDYGYEPLYPSWADMLDKKLSNEEIATYAKSVAEQADYDESDYDQIFERLHEFKDKYIDK